MKSIKSYINESAMVSELVRTPVTWEGIEMTDYLNPKLKRHKQYTVKTLDSYIKRVNGPKHITLNYDYEIDETNPIHTAARIIVTVKTEDVEAMKQALKEVRKQYNITYFDIIENKKYNVTDFLFDNSK